MFRLAVCLLLVIAATSCTVVAPPPEPLGGEAARRIDPCANATEANLSAECFEPNPDVEHLVGRRCELHPDFTLQRDIVRFAGGFASSPLTAERPGLYIHSCLAASTGTGCLMGKPFTEVAYCPECRRIRAELERGGR